MTGFGSRTMIGAILFALCSLWSPAIASPPISGHDTDNVQASTANDGSVQRNLTLRSDGNRFTLEFRSATRRQVLEHLLASSGTVIIWLNSVSEKELIEGRHVGSLEEILMWLLSSTNYIIDYDASTNERRMTKVVILARGSRSANAGPLQPVQTAHPLPQALDRAPAKGTGSVEPTAPPRISEAAQQRVRDYHRQARLKMLQTMKAAAERRQQ